MVSSAAKNSLFPLFVVGPDACARAAVRWIGHGPLCVPNLVHQLQWWAAAFLLEILRHLSPSAASASAGHLPDAQIVQSASAGQRRFISAQILLAKLPVSL